ncbi:MAG: hypothetical protein HY040_23430 [Planctomycetes bacterium]|nr:hypothetical protein [Planctomycetota bacterium]
MFATGFYLEREPLSLAQLAGALVDWLQNFGALAALGLVAWCIAHLVQMRGRKGRKRLNPLFIALVSIVFLLYAMVGALFLGRAMGIRVGNVMPSTDPSKLLTTGDWLLALAGSCAVLAVLLPMLGDLGTGRLRWRRIVALARLSFKEAMHRRVLLLVFAIMALLFLFASWFLTSKDEDQLRTYVWVMYFAIKVIFIMLAILLGAFGIPTDIKSLSIHTIVTKPVEKFEIVLGRFFGYCAVLTLGMAVISALSLLYIYRGINEKALEESYKARVPVYGELYFAGTKQKDKGENVGRMWAYRSYITGPHPTTPNASRQYAIWAFDAVPAEIARRDGAIPFEFSFDIFRMSKTKEDEQGEAGIYCTFTFADGRLPLTKISERIEDARKEKEALNAKARKTLADKKALEQRADEIERELAHKYGLYSISGVRVVDYHTLKVTAPADLFRKLQELESESPREATPGSTRPPSLQVLVSVDRDTAGSSSQMLGVAKRDFYLLAAERPFLVNFLKGIVGIWFTLVLILGIAVTCSTYLSGVISMLVAIFLFFPGLFVTDIEEFAKSKTEGGPLESLYRIAKGAPEAAPLDSSPATSFLKSSDVVYRWWLLRFLTVIPDFNRYDLNNYVGNGFDIPWIDQGLFTDNLVPLLGFLIPCAILAYYLMKFREIANPT